MRSISFLNLLLLLQPSRSTIVTITVTAPQPTSAPSFTHPSLFTSSILTTTNLYRARFSARPLSWNSTLAAFASTYLRLPSHSLSSTSSSSECPPFEHSGGPYGENLAMGYATAPASVQAWGDESRDYKPGDGFSEETGHFTQLVWRATTDVGCAARLCGEAGWYLVCEYWPRGNVVGEYDGQVGREVKTSSSSTGSSPEETSGGDASGGDASGGDTSGDGRGRGRGRWMGMVKLGGMWAVMLWVVR